RPMASTSATPQRQTRTGRRSRKKTPGSRRAARLIKTHHVCADRPPSSRASMGAATSNGAPSSFCSLDDAQAEPRQLTEGDFDAAQAVWSPDGALIAFVANREDDANASLASDIWTVAVEDGALRRLTDGDLSAMLPAWSPDGESLAFFADHPLNARHGYEDPHIWLVSRAGGDQRDLMSHLDRTLAALQPDYAFSAGAAPLWSPDGQTLFFVSAEHGADAIFALAVKAGSCWRVSSTAADIE